jgi:hypothetical protein
MGGCRRSTVGADLCGRRSAVGGALGRLGPVVAAECLVEAATGQTLTRQGHAVLALGSPWKRLAIARPGAVIRWA